MNIAIDGTAVVRDLTGTAVVVRFETTTGT